MPTNNIWHKIKPAQAGRTLQIYSLLEMLLEKSVKRQICVFVTRKFRGIWKLNVKSFNDILLKLSENVQKESYILEKGGCSTTSSPRRHFYSERLFIVWRDNREQTKISYKQILGNTCHCRRLHLQKYVLLSFSLHF